MPMSWAYCEDRPERRDHRPRPGDVRVAGRVDRVPVADAAERHVLQEAGHDDAVVALRAARAGRAARNCSSIRSTAAASTQGAAGSTAPATTSVFSE